jgi:hypothetical protein
MLRVYWTWPGVSATMKERRSVDPPRRARRQQDGPDRLVARPVRGDRRRVPGLRQGPCGLSPLRASTSSTATSAVEAPVAMLRVYWTWPGVARPVRGDRRRVPGLRQGPALHRRHRHPALGGELALRLRAQPLAGIDQQHRDLGGRGAGRHVAGVLDTGSRRSSPSSRPSPRTCASPTSPASRSRRRTATTSAAEVGIRAVDPLHRHAEGSGLLLDVRGHLFEVLEPAPRPRWPASTPTTATWSGPSPASR